MIVFQSESNDDADILLCIHAGDCNWNGFLIEKRRTMNFTIAFSMISGTFWLGKKDDKRFKNFEHFAKFCMNEVNHERC